MKGSSRGELSISPAFVAPGTYLEFLLESPLKYVGKARKYGAGTRVYILARISTASDDEDFLYQSWIIHILEISPPRTNSLTETMNATNS